MELVRSLAALSLRVSPQTYAPASVRCLHVTASLCRHNPRRHQRPKHMEPSSRTQRWAPLVSPRETWGCYTTEPLPQRRRDGKGPSGRLWYFRRGGGLKKDYYMVDFIRGGPSSGPPLQERVLRLMEDKNRSAELALVAGSERKRWIIATANMKEGDVISSSTELTELPVRPREGDSHPVGSLPVGTLVNCLQKFPGEEQGRLVTAAGTAAQVLKKVAGRVLVRLPSKQEVSLDPLCVATVGQVGNVDWNQRIIGTAGNARRLGIRPKSGLWRRKDGRFGRKIKGPKSVKVYDTPAPKRGPIQPPEHYQ